MTYRLLITGDGNVVRFWQAAQLARPQLVGVPLKPATCLDTLEASLVGVTDEYDYVLVSVLTSLLLDVASASNLANSCSNIIQTVAKRVATSAKKSARVEVSCFCDELVVLIQFI